MLSTVDQLFRRSRRRLSDSHPLIDQLMSAGVRYYARGWIMRARIRNSLRYDAPIEPARLYQIDPSQIQQTVSWTRISADRKSEEHPRFQQPKYRLAGRVFDGDWDTGNNRITESTIYQSFRAHFEAGVSWDQTAFYEETRSAIEAGSSPWDCGSVADLDERCQELDRLYEQIAEDGYKTQDELYEAGVETTSPHRLYRRIWGEIGVHIGRDGEVIFQDGRNRLTMALLCDLDRVPVVILVRHSDWQATREHVARGEITRGSLPERLQEHPDLVDLF